MISELPGIEQPALPFIGGVLLQSDSSELTDVVNPSNGRACLSIPVGSDADADRAVRAAREAFEDGRWSDAAPSQKKTVLHRFADLIAANTSLLDTLDAGEMGKPVGEKFGSAAAAAELIRFYAEAIDKVHGQVYASDHHSFVTQRRVPRGVVAAIVPWNFPTYVAAFKIGPALAAGNCVVLKPSELSSRSAVRLAQLAVEAGLPAGVLNVVPGLGGTIGRALGLHQDVDMITFTGSTAVGKRMLEYAGQSNLKAIITECGGKSPQIVFDDGVDLDAAADSIARFLLTNQGQICSVGSRLLVQRTIERELVEKIVARMDRIVMGNALDPSTTFGPLASARQFARVLQYIEDAPTQGAELICGGRKVLAHTGGYFIEPTVFTKVSPAARLAREEVFGPVLAVTTFDAAADAIRIANDSMYGLSAYVWTADVTTAMRMAKGIRSSVFINSAEPQGEGAGHAASSEPTRQSGIGTEGGLAGMESYMRRQLVWLNHG